MILIDILMLIDPDDYIGVMEPGLRGGLSYYGEALGAVERRDIAYLPVTKLKQELIDGARHICIYVSR